MSKDEIQRVVDSMDPHDAVEAIVSATRKLLSLLDEEARRNFLVGMVGDEGHDKIAGLVHL